MKFAVLLALCLISYCSAQWCCGNRDTPVTSKVKSVVRSRTIPKTTIKYQKLKTGYKVCQNNTISEKDVPKGPKGTIEDNEANRKKYGDFLSKILDSLSNGNHGTNEYHSYCPVYTTTSHAVVGYVTEYYLAAKFDDEGASCPARKKVCCRGYEQVGDNCVDEKKAGSAASSLDYLKSIGIVG
ncbi:uncharacterized protein [Watersipora subatra]|uniref:uncharacterized protein n=1 Tax=Watersipora subatra TaxID=2589382 RepID=UPI00355B0317